MRSEEIRQGMYHEARMCAEYVLLGLWDQASSRAKSYQTLEKQLHALLLGPDEDDGPLPAAGPDRPAT